MSSNASLRLVVLLLFIASLAMVSVPAAEANRIDPDAVVFIDTACLTDVQFRWLERRFGDGVGGASAPLADVSACLIDPSYIIDPSYVPTGRGDDRVPLCGLGPGLDRGCALIGLLSEAWDFGGDRVGIINPDTMHPDCLVGANPTPHP